MSDYRLLQNVAYDRIREMIYSRELEFGMIYSETRLAQALSVSRTPVRDALNRLGRERYIDFLPNKGFQLHKPDQNDLREAYHVRMMIECYCGENLARNCASEAGQEAIARMQECIDHQVALLDCESSMDLRKFWLNDQEFHFAPLNFMNISAFNMQYDSFLHIFMPQHLKNDYVVGRKHSTVAEHRAIVQGLREGDLQKTRSAIEKHLDSTLRLCLINFATDANPE